MANEFAGIVEKLIRANENIDNLEAEMARFFEESKYPVLPERDRQLLLEAIEYHKNCIIPLRFSVLAGEVVHQLRSCLDHVAWIFSSTQYRNQYARNIGFPIFEKRPVDKDRISLYERKVKGITNGKVVDLIESLQPYNSPDPIDSLLFTIHNFDVIDKHRELMLCVPTGAREIPKGVDSVFESYKSAHPELSAVELAFKFKGQEKLVPKISFRNFGRRAIEPVVPALMELFNEVVIVVNSPGCK